MSKRLERSDGASRMVGQAGIEPAAKGLKGLCSTTELLTQMW